MLTTRGDDVAVDREVPHAGQEGEIAQFGELGADLAGVGVDRVATGDHEVERPAVVARDPFERGRERPGRRQRVGPREREVGDQHAVDVDAAVGAPRDRLPQRVLRRGRPEREDGDV